MTYSLTYYLAREFGEQLSYKYDSSYDLPWSVSTKKIKYSFLDISNPPSYYTGFIESRLLGEALGETVEDFYMLPEEWRKAVQFILGDPQWENEFQSAEFRMSYSDVLNISFEHKPLNPNDPDDIGEVTFIGANISTLGRTYYPSNLELNLEFYQKIKGDTFIDVMAMGVENYEIGTQGYWLLMHELGHAFGGFKDIEDIEEQGSSVFPDTKKYTIMSYKNDFETFGFINVQPYSLQILDILSLQNAYGNRNFLKNIENTVYAYNKGFAEGGWESPFYYTIWDGGGDDTIDASGFDVEAQIDLRQGRFSSIGYSDEYFSAVMFDSPGGSDLPIDSGNVAIAFYTVIENAIGTDHDDILIGNAWGNRLEGGKGNDTLYGDSVVYDNAIEFTGDNDPLRPQSVAWKKSDPNRSGDDVLIGGHGTDTMFGGAGNDLFIAHANEARTDLEGDVYDGGGYINRVQNGETARLAKGVDGFDAVDYSGIPFAIFVDYTGEPSDGYATVKHYNNSLTTIRDRLYSIEGLTLTNYNDYLKLLAPEAGVERSFDGGGGDNTIEYTSAALVRDDTKGVVYNMEQTGKDIITNFKNVIGALLVTVTSSDDESILTMPALYIAPNVTKAYALNASSGSIVDYAASEYDLSFVLGYGYGGDYALVHTSGGDLRQELGAAPKMIYGSNAHGNSVFVGTAGAAFTGGAGNDVFYRRAVNDNGRAEFMQLEAVG